MKAFLIQYCRKSGAVNVRPLNNLSEATAERLKLDKTNHDPDLEIVAIASESEASLKQSHFRYFARM
ncbi:Uncharacterised protein [Corynebacterium renale]|nr:Uncharacterised protein [Corynebacterium renale]